MCSIREFCCYTVMYIAYHSRRKTFTVSHLYLHSTKNFHGYQLLQAFIVFTYKNSPKNFCGCKVIHGKHKFSPQIIIISNIQHNHVMQFAKPRTILKTFLHQRLNRSSVNLEQHGLVARKAIYESYSFCINYNHSLGHTKWITCFWFSHLSKID